MVADLSLWPMSWFGPGVMRSIKGDIGAAGPFSSVVVFSPQAYRSKEDAGSSPHRRRNSSYWWTHSP